MIGETEKWQSHTKAKQGKTFPQSSQKFITSHQKYFLAEKVSLR